MGNSIQIDGIHSGLPTGDLIDAEIAVLEIPLNKTKTKLANLETFNDSLRSLRGSLSNYSDILKELKPQDFSKYSGTSSNAGLTIDASKATSPVSLAVQVTGTASRHSMVTGAATAVADTAISISIGGKDHAITASSTSFADVAKAINGAGVGVNATVVAAGKDPVSGESLYRLQLSSADTGAASSFTATIGGADVLAGAGATQLTTGADATAVLYAGTPAEQTITSSTNLFTDVIPGVDFTVTDQAVGAGNIKLDVTADPKAQEEKATQLVDDLNKILSYIDSATKVTTTGSGTTTSAKGGVFTGDLLIRDIRNDLMATVTTPISGNRTYATIGIDIDKYGAVTFNKDTYNKAMATNPSETTALMAELSERINKVAENATDKYDGTLTKKVEGGESEVRTLEDQIQRHSDRLDVRRDTIRRQYTTMETLMGTMNTTMKYLQSMYSTMFKSDDE